MNRIWKFEVYHGETGMMIHGHSPRYLDFQYQNGKMVFWALVDTTEEEQHHVFKIYGTGHEVTHKSGKYIGTLQDPDGLVWHLFEIFN